MHRLLSISILANLLLAVSSSMAQTSEVRTSRNDPALPNVLIIGDSISIGYTAAVTRLLAGTANVERVPENCQSTVYALANIKKWLGGRRWDVIHFNWGIWDLHHLDGERFAVGGRVRTTPEQYRRNLVMLLGFLKATDAQLIWASTTPVSQPTDPARELNAVDGEDVPVYNSVAKKVMKQNRVQIDDLFRAVSPHVGKYWQDDHVHFNAAGDEFLAQQVAQSIRTAIDQRDSRAP
jgi:hypothetical protein